MTRHQELNKIVNREMVSNLQRRFVSNLPLGRLLDGVTEVAVFVQAPPSCCWRLSFCSDLPTQLLVRIGDAWRYLVREN